MILRMTNNNTSDDGISYHDNVAQELSYIMRITKPRKINVYVLRWAEKHTQNHFSIYWKDLFLCK